MPRTAPATLTLMFAALAAVWFALASASPTTAQGGCTSDIDSDGVCDVPPNDNCSTDANPGQRDDDEDGYGNLCDFDPLQLCFVGAPQVAATFQRSFDTAPWLPKNRGAYDITEDNVVGAPDVHAIFQQIKGNVGPTSLLCADCTATPTAGPGLGACPPVP